MFGARFSREVVGLGLVVGLALALVEPLDRLIVGVPQWIPAVDRGENPLPVAGTRYNLHLVPYGIERGLCDRLRLAADLKADLKTGEAGIADLLVGNFIGAKMDSVDQGCVSNTLEYAPDQRRVLWRNPDSGAIYTVVPIRTFQNDRGVYCREFNTSLVIGNQLHQMHGTACRQTAGAWTTVH